MRTTVRLTMARLGPTMTRRTTRTTTAKMSSPLPRAGGPPWAAARRVAARRTRRRHANGRCRWSCRRHSLARCQCISGLLQSSLHSTQDRATGSLAAAAHSYVPYRAATRRSRTLARCASTCTRTASGSTCARWRAAASGSSTRPSSSGTRSRTPASDHSSARTRGVASGSRSTSTYARTCARTRARSLTSAPSPDAISASHRSTTLRRTRGGITTKRNLPPSPSPLVALLPPRRCSPRRPRARCLLARMACQTLEQCPPSSPLVVAQRRLAVVMWLPSAAQMPRPR
mmetsp:Transcript_31100/g.77753  ORF Transcript_31100/g.77753 Transcript_31100/m.77753 type:complete len:287 (+) Transcript_31100:373-1233(+)